MKPSFHEDYSRKEEVKGASDRGFGLTLGGILLSIAAARTGLHLWDGTDPGWIEGHAGRSKVGRRTDRSYFRQ